MPNIRALLLTVCVTTAALCQQPQSPKFSVQVPGLTPMGISAADLGALEQHKIKVTGEHSKPAEYQGVLLSDVLEKAGVKFGKKMNGRALSQYVLIRGADGYRALFSIAELDPTLSDKRVYVVTSRDGQELDGKEGPFRVIVPDEQRTGRWVRQLMYVTVRETE